MTGKILVTPRSFGKTNPELFTLLEDAGLEVKRNTSGNIFTKEDMIREVADCDGLIVGVDPVDSDVLAAAPKLKAIAKYGVGVDNIDLNCAKGRGIRVSTTVGANSEAVADEAFAMMLSFSRKIPLIDRKCREGNWHKITTHDIEHKTLGIIGMGAIGKIVARRAAAFDMQIMGFDVFWDEEFANAYNIRKASQAEIIREADFITLHVPLMDSTRNMISAEQLALMKPNAVVINTARGGLIDENALLDALENGQIGGACIDTFAEEPPKDPRWFTLDNVILGSHCAASTTGAARNMGYMAAQNLIRDLGV